MKHKKTFSEFTLLEKIGFIFTIAYFSTTPYLLWLDFEGLFPHFKQNVGVLDMFSMMGNLLFFNGFEYLSSISIIETSKDIAVLKSAVPFLTLSTYLGTVAIVCIALIVFGVEKKFKDNKIKKKGVLNECS